MSAEFAAGVTDYREVIVPPPFGERRQSQDQMVAQIHRAFGALMKRKDGGGRRDRHEPPAARSGS